MATQEHNVINSNLKFIFLLLMKSKIAKVKIGQYEFKFPQKTEECSLP